MSRKNLAVLSVLLRRTLVICGLACIPISDVTAQVIEEIIVTSRKRTESLQDIPLSVTAFSQAELERGAYVNLEDISFATPGMQFNNELAGVRPGRLYSNIRFRGIEGSEFSTLQTASLFIDGVFALQGAQTIALTDLERVEVIKGPQSASFGRNSFAGAINYITTTPSLDEFKGKLISDFGTYGQYENAVSMEAPIIDGMLSLRVGARLYNKGNMFTSSDGGALGEQRSETIYATLYAEPNESLSIKARVYYQVDDDGPEATAFLAGRLNDTCTGTTRPGLDEDGNPTTITPTLFFCGTIPNPGRPGAPRAGAGIAVVDQNTQLFPKIFARQGNPNYLLNNLINDKVPGFPDAPVPDGFGIQRELIRLSLVGEYEFDNGMGLTTTLSYNENDAAALRDFDSTAVEVWWMNNPQTGEDFGAEIRLESSDENRLRWLGGFSYYEQEFLTSGSGGILAHACGIDNFFPRPDGTFPCDNPLTFPLGQDGGDFVDVWGVYGAISYDVSDQITVDLEGRYQSDKRSDGFSDFSQKFKNFLPRASVSYKPTEEINMYLTGSRGMLPGVLNANILACTETPYNAPFTDPRTGQPSTSSSCDQYREALGPGGFFQVTPDQFLDSVEFGIKSKWLEDRLLLNVALYMQKWKSSPYQTFVTLFLDDDRSDVDIPDDGIPNTIPTFRQVSTPGSSKYRGAELESAFVFTENWNVNFNLTYNDNEFTEFLSSLTAANTVLGERNIKGNRAARFPKWSGYLSSTYTGHLSGDWDWYARGDLSYMGKAVAGITNLATLDDYFLVNSRVGIENEDVRVELYVKNMFDTRNWRGGVEFADFSLQPDPFFAFNTLGVILLPQNRRTFGVRASVGF